jgi:hypothetical protein
LSRQKNKCTTESGTQALRFNAKSFGKNESTMSDNYSTPDYIFTYTKEQRSRFQSGKLVKLWRKTYPQLFDERDEHFACTQPDNHFFEWLSAILFYESTGYLSLQEYILRTHPRKRNLFKSFVSKRLFDNIDFDQGGLPDLFLYSNKTRDWFFCEVKGGSDRIRPNQIKRFGELEKLTGIKPKLVKLKLFVP